MKKNILTIIFSIITINSFSFAKVNLNDFDYSLYKKQQKINSWFLFQQKDKISSEITIMANLEPLNKTPYNPTIFIIPHCYNDKSTYMNITIRFVGESIGKNVATNNTSFFFDNKQNSISNFNFNTNDNDQFKDNILDIHYIYNTKNDMVVQPYSNNQQIKDNQNKTINIFKYMTNSETMKIKFPNTNSYQFSEYNISGFNNVIKELRNQCTK